jgi:hypothetical protein
MNKKLFLSFAVLFCLLAFPLEAAGSASGLAASSQPGAQGGDVATLSVTPAGLVWQPLVDAAGWSLRVVGPDGKFYEREFVAGSQPVFVFKDLPDGLYTYELWGTPLGAPAVVGREGKHENKAGQLSAETIYISGTFIIRDGAALLPDPLAVEEPQPPAGPSAPEDWVLADDLIVDGNACIGQNCSNGEFFLNEPLKLRWVNQHINFEDSSTTLGWPSNDWAIDVNDDAENGSNYFAIRDVTGAHTPFKIMAGARSNSIYVDSMGNVGIGGIPYHEFQIDTIYEPSVYLHQTSPDQMWSLNATDENFNIWNDSHGVVPFEIEAAAPTYSLYIDSTGKVGVGTDTPSYKLHVAGNIYGANNLILDGFVNERSDVASKTAFAAVDNQDVLERLASVPINTWSYKDSPEVRHMGPTAQDFRAAYGLGPDDKHLAALDTNGVALAAIQALDAQEEVLVTQNEELKGRVQALEVQLAARSVGGQITPFAFGLLGVLAGMLIARKKKA